MNLAVKYLLDSHIVYWFRIGDERLSADIQQIIQDTGNPIYYSVVTPWELSIKVAKGKLALSDEFFTSLPNIGFDCVPINEVHVEIVRNLPKYHNDPFDRMLIAQAKAEQLTLITADKELAAYPIKTLLVGA